MIDFPLYCPECGDRIRAEALAIALDELTVCKTCFAPTKGADLLTSHGRKFEEHLVWLSEHPEDS